MRRNVGVGVILLLALGSFASPALAQDTGNAGARERTSRLGPNYPNPFNPETFIPFVLNETDFESGRPVRVTIRVYNVLQQLVAVPLALNHPSGSNVVVDDLEYTAPGQYTAFWDGRDRSGRKVASGIYFLQMVVNGQAEQIRRMYVAK